MTTLTPAQGKDHLVWEVYDLRRTARLNVKCYSIALHKLESWSRNLDIAIAIGAPASAAAGFFAANIPYGDAVWKGFSSLTAIVAMIKPFWRLADKIKKIEQVLSIYRETDFDLEVLAIDVRKEQNYSKAHQKRFATILNKYRAAVVNPPKIQHDKALIAALELEILSELPDSAFFIPGEAK